MSKPDEIKCNRDVVEAFVKEARLLLTEQLDSQVGKLATDDNDSLKYHAQKLFTNLGVNESVNLIQDGEKDSLLNQFCESLHTHQTNLVNQFWKPISTDINNRVDQIAKNLQNKENVDENNANRFKK